MALILVIALGDAAIVTATWDSRPIVDEASLSPVLLAFMFGFVEWRVIHIQFRAEASSFSLIEIPLVLGVLFVPPHHLVPAAMAGMVLGLAVGRRQAFLKVAFNVVNVGLYSGIAWLIVDTLGPHGELGRPVWIPVFIATILGTTVNVGSILAAITLTEGPPDIRAAGRLVGFATAMAAANTALGLVAAMLLPEEALGIALLLVPAAMVLLAFQMLASERAQRERVEFLYRSSRLLDSDEADRGPTALLEASCEMFRASTSALILLPDASSPAVSVTLDDRVTTTDAISTAPDVARLTEAYASLVEPRLVGPDDRDALAAVVRHIGGRDAIVAPLATEDRDLGLLIVANRLGEASSFSNDDLQVLGALAAQSSVLLHNDRLEHALDELRDLERRLAHQATHDSLTGLPNRALFTQRLDEVAAGIEPFAVLFLDLDDFKIVNDTRGHADGDVLLAEVGRRLTRLLRPIDTAARLGGDEFAVLIRDHAYPREVADRIVTALTEPIDVAGVPVSIGCSVGVATADETRDSGEILQRADLAMYQAKRSGKRGVVEYESGIEGRREIDFKANLRDAIRAGQLELHYQPMIALDTGEVECVEALVRWRCPERGLLLPGAFITQAENDGFIVPIDRWVLEQATRDLQRLQQLGHRDLVVAVNVSARHLQAPDLVAHITSLVPSGRRGFDRRLLLEVTETALMGEIERSRDNSRAIRELDVMFALDDFGTGYSSIGYLREFDLDVLKIAGSFVADGTNSDRDRDFVGAMIELGHALGLSVVGEGVEEPAQAEMLASLGCDMAQGFLFARPMPFDRLVRLLETPEPTRKGVALTLR
jgi:diguanylate cyclase (GGDEF)-like protein